MKTAGPIIVHHLEHALAALAVAEDLDCSVTLLSPPAAAGYMGPAYFREMIAEAAKAHPKASFTAILDCGDEAGTAMKALREGIKHLRMETSSPPLAEIAAQYEAQIDTNVPDCLDLAEKWDCQAAIRAWLQ